MEIDPTKTRRPARALLTGAALMAAIAVLLLAVASTWHMPATSSAAWTRSGCCKPSSSGTPPVAMLIALQRPDQVLALVLVATGARLDVSPGVLDAARRRAEGHLETVVASSTPP